MECHATSYLVFVQAMTLVVGIAFGLACGVTLMLWAAKKDRIAARAAKAAKKVPAPD